MGTGVRTQVAALERLSGTVEAAKFTVQADGSSAFSVTGKGFVRGAAITANGRKLATIFGNAGWLTATMPAVFYEKPAIVAIKVVNPSGKESNSVDFTVTDKKRLKFPVLIGTRQRSSRSNTPGTLSTRQH